ncbi:PA14 domain-containing protein [Oligoflexus tunisiensis]|uniref:PA14 domain-containing protein n=1 Tax=Oligoflexus tunisiensis TaxID=708132 RepID=UPI00159EF698|nr:PA14 domain-containing protein [Oligoflexus tunisiensis]
MQGLQLSALFSVLLCSACANEKFSDQVQQTQTTATTAPQDTADQTPEVEAPVLGSQPDEADKMETPPVASPLFTDCQNAPDRPIVGDLYQLAPDSKHLPNFHKMKALKQVCLAQLDIKTRNFSEGFPGVENLFEWFSLDMRFAVKIPGSGKWEFKLVADDGAVLYIDQNKVIDNDGLHETQAKNGRSRLSAGIHDFRVSYFQGPRYDIALELYWKGPQDSEFSYIPAANLMRPRDIRLFSDMP